MTNPFASINGTPQDPLGHQAERDERNSSVGKPAEGIQADKLTATSVLLKEMPFDSSEPPPGAEADSLLKPCETLNATGLTALPLPQRKPLHGGCYSPDEALEVLNSRYLIGNSEQEIAIFRIKDDGSLAFMPSEQFKLDLANIFVEGSGRSAKPIEAEKFWKAHAQRHQRKIVFKPGGTTQPDEFNLWQGFGVVPRRTRRKIWSLLRHIWKVICRSNKAKFKYLIRWLAWAVQNPDKHPETVIVLKSPKQGTGKSTLGLVMYAIFGKYHGAIVDDKQRLIGQFNDWIEPMSFILAEEILWAGDHRTADKLKSMITAPTNQIERKGGAIQHIPNRLHLKLGSWHPREILKTAATEQQRMSGDSVSQWSQACVNADAVVGRGWGHDHDLGAPIPVEYLREAYTAFCKQSGLRPLNPVSFGKACADMFGPRKRLSAVPPVHDGEVTQADVGHDQEIQRLLGPRAEPDPAPREKPRPWGYDVPDGEKWQEKVDARLGIKK